MIKTIMAISSLTMICCNLAIAAEEESDAAALERGEDVFDICAGCHGDQAEGSEDMGAPKLSGQFDWYLLTQLKNFRAELRGTHEADENGQIMQLMAADLEDQEIADVVAYIATLDPNYVAE